MGRTLLRRMDEWSGGLQWEGCLFLWGLVTTLMIWKKAKKGMSNL